MPTLKRLQAAELAVFKELQRLCEKHSLRYYLIGGSALGAVRHSGFIPWDDDIDVGMPRPDYEAFSVLCCSELNERFFWQTYRTERCHTAIYGKLRMNDTVYKESPTMHLPIHHGIKIDVFPVDGTPRHSRTRTLHRLAFKLCMMKIGADLKLNRATKRQERVAKLLPRRIAIFILEKMSRWFAYDRSEVVVNAGGAWGYEKESAPRAWFAEGVRFRFEDTQAPLPTHWDKYLTRMYGDYMQFPPEEERLDRHPHLSIDFGTVLPDDGSKA
jgi:lipopolysaccharide cholinephosphotransferase